MGFRARVTLGHGRTDREVTPSVPSLQQGDAAAMNGASEDIKIKCRLLATDPSLIKLHRDLVASGAITEEEFWSTRQVRLSPFAASIILCWQELLKTQAALLAQKTPPSIALEGAASKTLPIEAKVVDKSITYTVTPGIIREIFARTPAVAKAHQELVAAEGRGKAARMSERDFWLAYFKSAFFDPGALRDPKNPLHAYLAVDEQPLAKEAPMEDELDEEPPEDLSADDESLQVVLDRSSYPRNRSQLRREAMQRSS